jgi:hypothetical protein
VAILSGCNSDVPTPASVQISDEVTLTITRTATHPFLARFNLRLSVRGQGDCRVDSDLFPDTGYISRRNLYRVDGKTYYVIGQYDARVVDLVRCQVLLVEFGSLKSGISFLGSFDLDDSKRWNYLAADKRSERPFEKR